MRSIAARFPQEGLVARGRRARYGLAVGLTAALLVALALVGGLSYAASSVHKSVAAAANVASSKTVQHKSDDHDSSADDEYGHCDGDNDGDDAGCKPPPPKHCDDEDDNDSDNGKCPKPPKHHKHHKHHHHHEHHGDDD